MILCCSPPDRDEKFLFFMSSMLTFFRASSTMARSLSSSISMVFLWGVLPIITTSSTLKSKL